MKNIFKILVCNASLLLITLSFNVKAELITLSDYLVLANPGDSWTYRTTVASPGRPVGTEFTITEPIYTSFISMFPVTANTGEAIPFEPNINLYLDIIPSVTVPAGTFTDVLRISWLDDKFDANSVNSSFGIDPLINQGVTDVDWYALGVGTIGYLGVRAEDGTFDGGEELISYSVSSVPIPAAAWLFSTGLLGLIGFARKKA